MAREIIEGKEDIHCFDDFKLNLLLWEFSCLNQIGFFLKKKSMDK